MKVLQVTKHSNHDLITKIWDVRLVGHGQVKPYYTSRIECRYDFTFGAVPCQKYLHAPTLATIDSIYQQLKPHPWETNGWLELLLEDKCGNKQVRPLLPPILEYNSAEDMTIICDGMHRVALAQMRGAACYAVVIFNPTHPYYAYPLEGGWMDVHVVDMIPEYKKRYREPNDHKALFRDFNAQFYGVQQKRVVGS